MTEWHARYGGPGVMIYWHIERKYTDTHGASIVGFAFCHLLGFHLLPRLKRIGAARLYSPGLTGDPTGPSLRR